MKRIFLILILQNFALFNASSQSFTVRDLLTLANLPSKNIGPFMKKNGFVLYSSNPGIDTMITSFIPKIKFNKNHSSPQRSIDLYEQHDSKSFVLPISSLSEYLDGQQSLIKSGFVYDNKKDISKELSILFQKGNITIVANKEVQDSITQYTFILKEKKIPDSIVYAEDLLQFDSHEFLVTFFGGKNVKKDMYYFSEKELKKCSVIFSGTRHQAVFVWGDENNLSNLSYVLVSNVLPTEGSKDNLPLDGNNEWKFQSGIRSGMPIKDLLRLNEMDFYVYGNKSDLAFMAKPGETGKINFKKTAIMFSCSDCYGNEIMDQTEISALDIAKAHLSMRVFDIIIYP
jgi:sorbitol-specific phosphotransferase system component IIA